jgi:hypothetical protein
VRSEFEKILNTVVSFRLPHSEAFYGCSDFNPHPKKATDYSKALATWLNDQHRRATTEYNAFVISEQKAIDMENRPTN